MVFRINLISIDKLDYRFIVFYTIIWVVLSFCISAPSFAKDVIIQMAKIQNDSTAQYFLGRRYLKGYGVDKNEEQAASWFLRAAEQGHVKAQYEVGLLYKNGMGVEKDSQAAFQYFLRAAEKGHSGAMFELGNYYFFGMDGSKDVGQAVIWYRNSAEKNHSAAQYQLGKILKEGIDVKVNKKEGQEWLDKAQVNNVDPDLDIVDSSNSSATNTQANVSNKLSKSSKNDILDDIRKEGVDTQFSMGMRYLNGMDDGAKQPEVAAQWLREAAQNEHAGAQFELSLMYLDGIGVEKSNGEAIKWLSKAARWGLPKAKTTLDVLMDELLVSYLKKSPSGPNIKKAEEQYKVGIFYLEGKHLKKNSIKAADWIIKAAKNNHPKAQFEAGMMYRNGVGIKKNLIQAKYWLEKASKNGDVDAREALSAFEIKNQFKKSEQSTSLLDPILNETQSGDGDPAKQYQAGMTLLKKKGVEKDTIYSIKWLTQAANQGHIDAQKQLAIIYSNSNVIARDLSVAAAWLNMAAEAGDADAQYKLGNIFKKGLGVDKSNSLAIKWYRLAARQGHPQARGKLGCRIC